MTKTFLLERPIDAIFGQRHLQIAAGRYSTSDRDVQRFLSRYPGCTLVASEPDPVRTPLTPEEALALHGPAPGPPVVTNYAGLQTRENRQADKWSAR